MNPTQGMYTDCSDKTTDKTFRSDVRQTENLQETNLSHLP